jgi:hypothetical protein
LQARTRHAVFNQLMFNIMLSSFTKHMDMTQLKENILDVQKKF